MSLRKPDFFIVGAPKCGTSSMWNYLAQHPQIFPCPYKEPRFFSDDMPSDERPATTLDAYLRLFDQAGDRLAGEASTNYLYSCKAPAAIHECNPAARIVIILRDPVEQSRSRHMHLLGTLDEDIADINEAIRAEPDRRAGRRIPETCRRPREALFYTESPPFAEGVKRYIDTFGRDQVHIILSDEFHADPAGTYRALLRFLGVDETFEPDFRRYNQSLTVRRRWLRRLQLNSGLQRLGRAVVPLSGRRQLSALLTRLSTKPAPKSQLTPAMYRYLCEQLRPEVDAIEQVIGRELPHWCVPPDEIKQPRDETARLEHA